MSQETEDKLNVITAMITSLGKITQAQIRLELVGQDALATQMDEKRQALLTAIQTLQGQVAEQWTIDAGTISAKLSEANGKVQDRIRNIQNNVNVANNAIQIIGQIDDALAFVKDIVKVVA
jgi:hypothetical protein